ncbi:transcription regulator, SpoVT/AbrB family [Thermococcus kodakarensis KOD1]|uniref:Transcription regulator, SpoVT/AbrB family n=1 Tax=Thermococcus kodakarensis (strain ATCC BAA-918 / JCM 12380 / KOD1) TaxID=69014 RepID=Q5JE05_THEKO|nr:AbrB/MazE/SpoVT family DNA-binding domain-containing protein [Thermococcus kodakarensis]WCN29034.1 AbrB/MazE/SpoVT family DNA-binding domain-containing protein [Thermococcus kodakarensis]WCN31339.1 AbrB/MazE/SpoVT family DNA-binding domain-containing protein [Thermococcus kodakarensis]BAD85265.1 transcription regulator, SpoVT/AbrB family [Thermococcus kodakarensis KOD1]
MVTVKVSSKGQIVLPKSIREKLGINPGDEVEVLDFGDEIVIVPVKKNVDLMGILKFDKPLKDVMREVREEERELEARKWGE